MSRAAGGLPLTSASARRAGSPRVAAWMRSSRRSSAFSFDSVYALGPSESARAGFSWTSMKIPSTPAATPAGPSVSMKWALAAGAVSEAAGPLHAVGDVEDDRVAERRAGAGNERMSTTRLL